jgi:hypothetical protein
MNRARLAVVACVGLCWAHACSLNPGPDLPGGDQGPPAGAGAATGMGGSNAGVGGSRPTGGTGGSAISSGGSAGSGTGGSTGGTGGGAGVGPDLDAGPAGQGRHEVSDLCHFEPGRSACPPHAEA